MKKSFYFILILITLAIIGCANDSTDKQYFFFPSDNEETTSDDENQSPVISSFTSDYSIIFVNNSRRDYTVLSILAADHEDNELSYYFEIVSDESNGFLTQNYFEWEAVYYAGGLTGNAQIRATVTDSAGATAEAILDIGVMDKSYTKISDISGNFNGSLDGASTFGISVANIGDLNGDGIADLAVGAYPYGTYGSIWILFMNPDGSVKSEVNIPNPDSSPGGDNFGSSIENMGDIDGDGITDIAVGAIGDRLDAGAVWILFLNTDGTVKTDPPPNKIANPVLDDDWFGYSIANMGDIDDDGINDIAIGAPNYVSSPTGGTIYISLLNSDGTIGSTYPKIDNQDSSDRSGDRFGSSIANIGDFDDDGITDIAVGAYGDTSNVGAIYMLFLNADCTVKSSKKIPNIEGSDNDRFGRSIANIGDIDGDNILDIAVGAYRDDDVGTDHGAVWILFMDTDGNYKYYQKINETHGNFNGSLYDLNYFAYSLANIGDIDGNGITDIAVGAYGDDDGGNGKGAVWILLLDKYGKLIDL